MKEAFDLIIKNISPIKLNIDQLKRELELFKFIRHLSVKELFKDKKEIIEFFSIEDDPGAYEEILNEGMDLFFLINSPFMIKKIKDYLDQLNK